MKISSEEKKRRKEFLERERKAILNLNDLTELNRKIRQDKEKINRQVEEEEFNDEI